MLGTKRWDNGFEQHYGIKNGDGIRGDCGCNQAICLEELLVADEFGCKRDVIVWGCLLCLFILTHINGVTQNTHLVSSLL